MFDKAANKAANQINNKQENKQERLAKTMNKNEEIRKQNIVEMPDFDSFIPGHAPAQGVAFAAENAAAAEPVQSESQSEDPAAQVQPMAQSEAPAMQITPEQMAAFMMANAPSVQDGGSSDHSEAAAAFAAVEKNLKRKSVTLMASIFLLIALLIIGSIAWYTRISGITGMTLEAAKFDFRANYVKDYVVLDVWDYMGVNNQKAAPGTGGVIPIRLSANAASETAVDYTINLGFVDMADKFRERLRYFYFTEENGQKKLHPIHPAVSSEKSGAITGQIQSGGTESEVLEYIYWEWVYELSSDWFYWNGYWYNGNTEYKIAEIKATFEDSAEEEVEKNLKACVGNNNATKINGKNIFKVVYPTQDEFYRDGNKYSSGDVITVSGLKDESAIKEYYGDDKATITGAEYFDYLHSKGQMTLDEQKAEFDAFDTCIGMGEYDTRAELLRDGIQYTYEAGTEDTDGDGIQDNLIVNPDDPNETVAVTAYQKAMSVRLNVLGAQARPVLYPDENYLGNHGVKNPESRNKGTTVYLTTMSYNSVDSKIG